MKQISKYLYCLIIMFILSSCGNTEYVNLSSVTILKENNTGLSSDISGIFKTSTEIVADLPSKIDLSSIIVNFEVSGVYNSIVAKPKDPFFESGGEINVISGVTPIDFTKGTWEIDFKDVNGTYIGQYFIDVGFPINSTMIPDETFFSLLRTEVGKDSFYSYDLNAVTAIDYMSVPSIQDFTGLEYIYLLRSITIDSSVATIETLKTLKNHDMLYRIRLYDTQNILDFSPISDFTNLEYLVIRFSNVESINFLSNIDEIEYLELSYSLINNISVLNSLTNCINLDLSYNTITDISALNSLTKLETLNINGNNMDLTNGSLNLAVVDQLVSYGCDVLYKSGNTID